MLRTLYVKNYALIEEIRVDFEGGLTTITGETGAGKSILLGALGLILGDRANLQIIKDKQKKSVIETTFDVSQYNLNVFFENNDLDYDDECIVRREISGAGKSRAFVNDTPVSIKVLKELGGRLVDIHSQHETISLFAHEYQMFLVDAFVGNDALLADYRTKLKAYKYGTTKLEGLKEALAKAKNEQDYQQFLLQELDGLEVDGDQFKELEEEAVMLDGAYEIKSALNNASGYLSGSGQALDKLNSALSELQQVADKSEKLSTLADQLQSAYLELEDAASEIERSGDDVNEDPERKQEVFEIIDTVNKLLRKHQFTTIDQLYELRDSMENALNSTADLSEEIASLEKELAESKVALKADSDKLHKQRLAGIPDFEKAIEANLATLGMESSQVKLELNQTTDFTALGTSSIVFMFSANKGGSLAPLKKAASGGELARFIISVKNLIASKTALPTIIFDEIDTGVSGKIADKIGVKMVEMAQGFQVFAITHLPQIAGKGNQHLKVYKTEEADRTITHLTKLTDNERVEELAMMLSGDGTSEAALANAKELLG